MAPADKTCVRITYKNSHYLVPIEFITRVHPGGQKLILPYVNQDITRAFVEAKHSDEAIQLLEEWMEGGAAMNAAGRAEDGGKRENAEAEETLASRWRRQFAAWAGPEAVAAPPSKLWNAFVFGVAGATAMAAVLCRQ